MSDDRMVTDLGNGFTISIGTRAIHAVPGRFGKI